MLVGLLLREDEVREIPVAVGAHIGSITVQFPVYQGKDCDIDNPQNNTHEKQTDRGNPRYPNKNIPHELYQTGGICDNKHTDEARRERTHDRAGFRPLRQVYSH